MKLQKALTYLDNVTKKSMAVPMRRYAGSTGRTAQGKCLEIFYMLDLNGGNGVKGRFRGELWNYHRLYDSVWVCMRPACHFSGDLLVILDDTVAARNSVWDSVLEQGD